MSYLILFIGLAKKFVQVFLMEGKTRGNENPVREVLLGEEQELWEHIGGLTILAWGGVSEKAICRS